MSMKPVLDALIATNPPNGIQICLRSAGPIGPGKVERFTLPEGTPGSPSESTYRIITPAQMGNARGTVMVKIPIIFDVADVVWIGQDPIAEDGTPIIQPVGNGSGRTPGGLHVPGR